MSRDYPTVDGHSNLQTFVEEHLVRTGRRCFVVTFNGHAEGIITPNEVSKVERGRWPYTTVADVMRPLNQVRTVAPNAAVTEALEMMAHEDLNQLPIVQMVNLLDSFHVRTFCNCSRLAPNCMFDR